MSDVVNNVVLAKDAKQALANLEDIRKTFGTVYGHADDRLVEISKEILADAKHIWRDPVVGMNRFKNHALRDGWERTIYSFVYAPDIFGPTRPNTGQINTVEQIAAGYKVKLNAVYVRLGMVLWDRYNAMEGSLEMLEQQLLQTA